MNEIVAEFNKISFHRGHVKTIGHLLAAAAVGASAMHGISATKRKNEWNRKKIADWKGITDTVSNVQKSTGINISKGSVSKDIQIAKPLKMDIVATPKQQKIGVNFNYRF